MEGQGGVDMASRSVSVRPPSLISQLWFLIRITRWKTKVKVVIKESTAERVVRGTQDGEQWTGSGLWA